MDFVLGPAAFSIPDDWRDNSTYHYSAPAGAGTLVVEVAHERRQAAELLQSAKETFLGVFEPAVIYHKEFAARRATEPSVVGVEGEQSAVDATGRHRFAVVPLVSGEWSAVLTFLLQPRRDFLDLVRAVVASFALADEPAAEAPPPTLRRRVRARGARFEIPRDWTLPTTLEFLDPERDDIEVTVTLEEPMAPAGSIRWASHVSGPMKIAREAIAPGTSEWSGEWSLERPPPYPSPYLFRKAAVQMGADATVTLYGGAPVSAAQRLDAAWRSLRATLRATGGA
jgi:hypothetical protein